MYAGADASGCSIKKDVGVVYPLAAGGEASFRDKDEREKFLRSKSSNVPNDEQKVEWSPLHWACLVGHEHIAELLLSKGAKVNSKDKDGWTPLLVACLNGHVGTRT